MFNFSDFYIQFLPKTGNKMNIILKETVLAASQKSNNEGVNKIV